MTLFTLHLLACDWELATENSAVIPATTASQPAQVTALCTIPGVPEKKGGAFAPPCPPGNRRSGNDLVIVQQLLQRHTGYPL